MVLTIKPKLTSFRGAESSSQAGTAKAPVPIFSLFHSASRKDNVNTNFFFTFTQMRIEPSVAGQKERAPIAVNRLGCTLYNLCEQA